MCTVLFIPNNNKQYFASLRDESPKRPRAMVPELYCTNETRYIMPKDALAGGTWLGINGYRNVIILLNGGYRNHIKKAFYKKSRGLIVKELLESVTPVIDWQLMDFNEIEPFTLVVWSDNHLFELVWDGDEKHRNSLSADQPHIWSSSTLYDESTKVHRAKLFQNWISEKRVVSEFSTLDFLRSTHDLENGFIINRDEVTRTLSYSFIELSDKPFAKLFYYDMKNLAQYSTSIDFSENSTSCMLDDYTNKRQ